MIGPLVVVVGGMALGAAVGGAGGAVGGLIVGVAVVGAVVAGAVVWSGAIGAHLDPADAWAVAPCLPGFGALCRRVYRRLLPGPAPGAGPGNP